MILENLKIFSQNIRKNNFIIKMILEAHSDFNIIFIQEPSWLFICSILYYDNYEDNLLMGIVNHPNWLIFTRKPVSSNDLPQVAIFVNIRLSSLYFSLRKDVINHRDILLLSFLNNGNSFWIMNVCSDSSHSAIKYLKDTELNIRNLLIMTGDFNICNSLWDPLYSFHSSISNNLFAIADSFNLFLLFPTEQVPTRFSDDANNSNSVLDLMFLWCNSEEINSHVIHLDWWLTSDHASLTITIPIIEEHITTCKRILIKNSVKEDNFVNEVIVLFSKVDTSNISSISDLDEIVLSWADIVDWSWLKYSKFINITKCLKSWWNNKCSQDLANYRVIKSIESWKTFHKTVKLLKREFFDLKIQEIANERRGLWELMNWVNKKKLPAIETIKHNGSLCLELNDFWQALYSSFNSAQFQSIDESILNKCNSFLPIMWLKFSEEEFSHAIINCKDSSTPSLDKMSW